MTFKKGDTINTETAETTPAVTAPMGFPPSPEVTGTNFPPATEETKADRFVRLAEARTKKTIKFIRSLGKLSAGAYEYTDEQVDMICTVLSKEVETLNKKLRRIKPEQEEFKLR